MVELRIPNDANISALEEPPHFLALSSVVSGPSPVSSKKTASNSAGSVALAFSLIVWCAPGFTPRLAGAIDARRLAFDLTANRSGDHVRHDERRFRVVVSSALAPGGYLTLTASSDLPGTLVG